MLDTHDERAQVHRIPRRAGSVERHHLLAQEAYAAGRGVRHPELGQVDLVVNATGLGARVNVGLRLSRNGGQRVELECRKIRDRANASSTKAGLADRGQQVGVIQAYGFGGVGYVLRGRVDGANAQVYQQPWSR